MDGFGEADEWPLRVERAGYVYILDLPWASIYSAWLECLVRYVVESVPKPCEGQNTMEVLFNSLVFAAEKLLGFSRAFNAAEVLRCSEHTHRRVSTHSSGSVGCVAEDTGSQ